MVTESCACDMMIYLLIEDNPGHAELVKRGLERSAEANKVYHLSDGEAALNYLNHCGDATSEEDCPVPNVILLDLRLPRVDGLEVLRQIKTNTLLQQIPVIILSTSQADDDVNAAYSNHANSYLVKPIDFNRFSELLKDLGVYWKNWNVDPKRAV